MIFPSRFFEAVLNCCVGPIVGIVKSNINLSNTKFKMNVVNIKINMKSTSDIYFLYTTENDHIIRISAKTMLHGHNT